MIVLSYTSIYYVKFADDLTLNIRVKSGASNSNSAANEGQSIVEWTFVNRMQLNLKKTWEILLKGKSTKALPVPLAFIERKPSLKLLRLTFQSTHVTGIYIRIISY